MTDAATPETAPANVPSTPSDVAELAEKLFAEETEDKGEKPEPGQSEEAVETPAEETPAEDTRPEWQRTKHKVRVNGADHEVEYDELVKGYSRLEDYKAKTAKLADKERQGTDAVAQERKRLADSANFFLQQAQILDPVLAEGFKLESTGGWADLAAKDPAIYVQKRAVFDQRLNMFRAAQQAAREQTERHEEKVVEEETAALVEKWPEWGDEKKRGQIGKELQDFAASTYDFSVEEIMGIKDHRAFLVLRDAKAYRDWKKAQSDAAKKRVQEAPKVSKPGASKVDEKQPESASLKALRKKATNTRHPMDVAELAAGLDWSGYKDGVPS